MPFLRDEYDLVRRVLITAMEILSVEEKKNLWVCYPGYQFTPRSMAELSGVIGALPVQLDDDKRTFLGQQAEEQFKQLIGKKEKPF